MQFSWKYVVGFLVFSFVLYLFMYPINEAFQNAHSIPQDCPNILVQHGSKFYLYNTKRIDVPGVNPIEFENLEEYVEFIKYQKKIGWNCPILYLQQTMGAQGNVEFRLRPDVLEPQAGLNPMLPSQMNNIFPFERKMLNDNLAQTIAQNVATSSNIPLTEQNLASLDLTSSTLARPSSCQGEDIKPPLINGKSPDPMEPEWGGIAFSENLVDSGYYSGNEIYKVTPGVYSNTSYNPTATSTTYNYTDSPPPPNTKPKVSKR